MAMTETADAATRTNTLRRVLALDALTAAGFGLAASLAAPTFEHLLAIPAGLALAAGVISLAAALVLAIAATSAAPPRRLVQVIVAGNALWVAASAALLVLGIGNGPGLTFIAAQGLFVLALTVMEHRLTPN